MVEARYDVDDRTGFEVKRATTVGATVCRWGP
jgi:hypothetical protein